MSPMRLPAPPVAPPRIWLRRPPRPEPPDDPDPGVVPGPVPVVVVPPPVGTVGTLPVAGGAGGACDAPPQGQQHRSDPLGG